MDRVNYHIVEDANDGSLNTVKVETDLHGLSITLPDGQVIVLDYCNETFSLLHYSSAEDANEHLLCRCSNGHCAMSGY